MVVPAHFDTSTGEGCPTLSVEKHLLLLVDDGVEVLGSAQAAHRVTGAQVSKNMDANLPLQDPNSFRHVERRTPIMETHAH